MVLVSEIFYNICLILICEKKNFNQNLAFVDFWQF